MPTRFLPDRHRGSVTIELAVVCLLLVAMLVPVFCLGRYLMQKHILDNAVIMTARYVARAPVADLTSRKTDAAELLRTMLREGGISATPTSVEISCYPSSSCSKNTTNIEVKVDVPWDNPFGDFMPDGIELNGAAIFTYPQ